MSENDVCDQSAKYKLSSFPLFSSCITSGFSTSTSGRFQQEPITKIMKQ